MQGATRAVMQGASCPEKHVFWHHTPEQISFSPHPPPFRKRPLPMRGSLKSTSTWWLLVVVHSLETMIIGSVRFERPAVLDY